MTRSAAIAGRFRRPGFLLSLPATIVLVGLGLVPLLLIAFWSFWTFDPATYWIKPDLTLGSYAALFETGRFPVFVRTLALAALAAGFSTLLGFPAAVIIGLMSGPKRAALLIIL